MKKILLASAIASVLSANAFANDNVLDLKDDSSVVRTGTAGGVVLENGQVHSGALGLDYKSGEIYIQTNNDNTSVFDDPAGRQKIGQFATHETMDAELDKRLTVVENQTTGDLTVEHNYLGDTTIENAGSVGNISNVENVTINNVEGSVGNICSGTGANNCTVNLDVSQADDATLAKIKGDTGEQGEQGVAGRNGRDGVRTNAGVDDNWGHSGTTDPNTGENSYISVFDNGVIGVTHVEGAGEDPQHFKIDTVTQAELNKVLNGGQTSPDDVGVLGDIRNVQDQSSRNASLIDTLIDDTKGQEEITDVSLDGNKLVINTAADSDYEGDKESSKFEVDLSKYDNSAGVDQNASDIQELQDRDQATVSYNSDGSTARIEDSEGNIVDVASSEFAGENRKWINEHQERLNEKDVQVADLKAADAVHDQRLDTVESKVETAQNTANRAIAIADGAQHRIDKEIQDRIAGDAATLKAANDHSDASDAAQDAANQLARDKIVADQAVVDANQDTANQAARDKIVADQAVTDSGQNAKIFTNTADINDNKQAITAVDTKVDANKAAQDAVNAQQEFTNANHNGRINDNANDIVTGDAETLQAAKDHSDNNDERLTSGELKNDSTLSLEVTDNNGNKSEVQVELDKLKTAQATQTAEELELYKTTQATRDAGQDQRIDTLFSEVDRLDDRIDLTQAMTQATLAAKPYLYNGQTSAIGVGIGHAGSAQALSFGYAQRLDENWTLNANATTSVVGGEFKDTSYGAGATYSWK